MERRYYNNAKSHVVRFKVDFCCWFVPVKIGLTIVGYFNIIADVICLFGIANDGFSPTIIRVQETLIEDFVSKPVPVLAYATELGFNVVLLCGIFRRDQVLLRLFMYYTLLAVVMSFLVYSIVIVAVPVQIQVAIVFSTLFQMYTVLLVRSVIVVIKMDEKKYELPRLVLSSHLKDKVIIPSSSYPKQIQEVIITELPTKQEVRLAIVDKDHEPNKEEAVVMEFKKSAEVKKDDSETKTDVDVKKVNGEAKKDVEVKKEDRETKKDVEVTIEPEVKSIEKRIEEKKIKEEKDKEDKKIKEVKEKEEKKIKEEKEREEKKIKEEKEREEKKIKEEKKKEDKKLKEEKKKEEKKIKEEKRKIKHEKKKEGKNIKDEKKKEENAPNEKENNEEVKNVENAPTANSSSSRDKQEVREAWLQAVTEQPKQ